MKRLPFLFVTALVLACLAVAPVLAGPADALGLWKTAKNSYESGKCVAALVYADRSIALDPALGRAWNIRGCALHCLGRNTKALEAFAKAAELDPSLAIAPKNLNHVQADIANGAPPDTPPVVIPPVQGSTIPRDGELAYASPGEPTGSAALLKEGHAVSFANNETIVVTGVRIAGCMYGDTRGKKARVEIRDANLSTVSAATVPYDAIPLASVKEGAACLRNATWADLDIPDQAVTGDFSLILFTGSGLISQKEPGLFIVYTTPSDAKTSSVAVAGQNRLEIQKVGSAGYRTDELDWMVSVLYTVPAPVSTTTGGLTASPQAPATAGGSPENPGITATGPGETISQDSPAQATVNGGTTSGPQQTATHATPSGLIVIAAALAIAPLRSASGR